jgi:hypothetical protein
MVMMSSNPSDVDATEFDLGTTSVRLIRVGNVVQAIFSNKVDAKLFYDDVESTFKSEEGRLRFK